jgi:hypothetical protein
MERNKSNRLSDMEFTQKTHRQISEVRKKAILGGATMGAALILGGAVATEFSMPLATGLLVAGVSSPLVAGVSISIRERFAAEMHKNKEG